MADPGPVTRAGAQADAHRILQGPQYRRARPSLLQRVVTRVVNDIEHALSRASDAVGGPVPLLALIAVVVVAVVLVKVRLGKVPLQEFFGGRGEKSRRLTAADYRDEAGDFAARGEFAEAVRASTRAMVRELEDRGVLEPAPGKTAAALSARAARAVPAVGPDAALIARVFDEIWYSARPGTAGDAAGVAAAELRISRQRLRLTEPSDLPDFAGLDDPRRTPVPADA